MRHRSRVVRAEPGRTLVLPGGVPLGRVPSPFDSTWAFALRAGPDGTTRLVVRERYAYLRRWAALVVEPAEAVGFLMTRRMLHGIRDRGEHRPARPAVRHAGH